MTINIGRIKYANCTPIFTSLASHFDCSTYRFIDGVPAELNAMLRCGSIDLSPSSSIEYAMAHEQYCLLPELSISAMGAVKSVFLFSRVPVEELDGCTIGLSAESDTSVNLLKVLLARKYGFRNGFERTRLPLAEALGLYPGLLLIGDLALKGAASRGGGYCYDLGSCGTTSPGFRSCSPSGSLGATPPRPSTPNSWRWRGTWLPPSILPTGTTRR